MTLKIPGIQLLALLTELVATGMVFAVAKIALYKNVSPITPETAFADLQPADYDGYAPSAAVTWLTPHLDGQGNGIVQCQPKEFKPTGDTTECIVTHVGLVNTGNTALLAFYELDTPIVFSNDQDVHLIGCPLTLSQPTMDLEDIAP